MQGTGFQRYRTLNESQYRNVVILLQKKLNKRQYRNTLVVVLQKNVKKYEQYRESIQRSSALEVSHFMRYTNLRLTYLLTYRPNTWSRPLSQRGIWKALFK